MEAWEQDLNISLGIRPTLQEDRVWESDHSDGMGPPLRGYGPQASCLGPGLPFIYLLLLPYHSSFLHLFLLPLFPSLLPPPPPPQHLLIPHTKEQAIHAARVVCSTYVLVICSRVNW